MGDALPSAGQTPVVGQTPITPVLSAAPYVTQAPAVAAKKITGIDILVVGGRVAAVVSAILGVLVMLVMVAVGVGSLNKKEPAPAVATNVDGIIMLSSHAGPRRNRKALGWTAIGSGVAVGALSVGIAALSFKSRGFAAFEGVMSIISAVGLVGVGIAGATVSHHAADRKAELALLQTGALAAAQQNAWSTGPPAPGASA